MRPSPSEERIRKAYADIKRVREMPQLAREERAMANYVYSLAYLRYFTRRRTEENALVKCLEHALEAAKESPVYLANVKPFFEYAATHAFQSSASREQSQKLQAEFRALTAASGN
jgi:hypothetical protein